MIDAPVGRRLKGIGTSIMGADVADPINLSSHLQILLIFLMRK
jgi:hypothetical protein